MTLHTSKYLSARSMMVNQSINQSIDQSINQSINQSVSQSVSQSINQLIYRSVNQLINQSINQSVKVFARDSSNNFQQVATTHNMVCKRSQHVGPTMLRLVGQQCCERLHGALYQSSFIAQFKFALTFFQGLIIVSWNIQRSRAVW